MREHGIESRQVSLSLSLSLSLFVSLFCFSLDSLSLSIIHIPLKALKVVMFFGSISGVIISIPCGLFLTLRAAQIARDKG